MADQAKKVNELAAQVADLDFNVSDEEIAEAKKLWLESINSAEDFSQVKTVQHPMLVVYIKSFWTLRSNFFL